MSKRISKRKITLFVAFVVLIISVGYLVNYYVIDPMRCKNQDKELEEIYEQLQNKNEEDVLEYIETNNPDFALPEGISPQLAFLYSENNEIAGWIKIPGAGINMPVMQTTDNEKYLTRDFYGNYTKYGEAYFDYRNSLDGSDYNTIIYGHNMQHDDYIFGMLENYRDMGFYKKNSLIYLETLEGSFTYKIAACIITPGDSKSANAFNYNFINADSDYIAEYLENVSKKALYDTGVELSENDKLLTLSTCAYDYKDARLVIVAKLIEN